MIAKPVFKWAGGKTQLLPELLARMPKTFDVYHEPFVGGGALYFALWNAGRITRAVLGDVNPDLMEAYEVLRDDTAALVSALREHRNERDAFYRVRGEDPRALSPIERAARMIYLNKTCFNGLYRVNSKGQFNVPFGDNRGKTHCDEQGLLAAAQALRAAELRVESFESTMRGARKGDFVYCDPPYQPSSKTAKFTQYSTKAFGEAEQLRLRDAFCQLVAKGVHVLLSNSDTPLTGQLYRQFRVERVLATRRINSKAAGRGLVSELLVSG